MSHRSPRSRAVGGPCFKKRGARFGRLNLTRSDEFRRLAASPVRRFDEALVRDFLRRDIDRAQDFAAARNHDLLTEGASSSEPPVQGC